MKLVKLRNTLIATSLLGISISHGATFGELADLQQPGNDINIARSQRTITFRDRQPVIPEPEYFAPWVINNTHFTPRYRFLEWAHGQQEGFDDPHSWEHLDNRYFWARWGNPLAPYTSAVINEWWRDRGRGSRPPGYAPQRW